MASWERSKRRKSAKTPKGMPFGWFLCQKKAPKSIPLGVLVMFFFFCMVAFCLRKTWVFLRSLSLTCFFFELGFIGGFKIGRLLFQTKTASNRHRTPDSSQPTPTAGFTLRTCTVKADCSYEARGKDITSLLPEWLSFNFFGGWFSQTMTKT